MLYLWLQLHVHRRSSRKGSRKDLDFNQHQRTTRLFVRDLLPKWRSDCECSTFTGPSGIDEFRGEVSDRIVERGFEVSFHSRFRFRFASHNDPLTALFALYCSPGDVILTNHPVAGGSHLPDITGENVPRWIYVAKL